jgi:hypothetical protein
MKARTEAGRGKASRKGTFSLAKGSKKRSFFLAIGTRPLFRRFRVESLVGVSVMLDLLLNHSAVFLAGELMLGVSLTMFGVALAEAVRDRYAIRIPVKTRDRSTR